MKRRKFLGFIATLAFVPNILFAAESMDYTPGLIKQQLDLGKTIVVDYAADWCGTCKRQERVINVLRTKNPEYDKKMIFVRVDWDDYSQAPVTTSRNIPRRSTLIVLKGDKELGRVVAGTGFDQIQELLDKGI